MGLGACAPSFISRCSLRHTQVYLRPPPLRCLRLSAHIRAALTSVCVPLLSDFVRARIRRLACSRRMLVRLGRRASPLHLPARLTTASISSIRAPSAYCVRGNRISVCAQAERRIARPESRLYCTNTSASAAQDTGDPDHDGGKEPVPSGEKELQVHQTEHAVISTFDLFSIGGR